MDVHPTSHARQLPEGLRPNLLKQRQERQFDPERYVQHKLRVLGEYLSAHELRGAVLGLSGGVDSAVVAGLLSAAKRQQLLSSVYTLNMPVSGGVVARQERARQLAEQVAQAFDLKFGVAELNPAYNAIHAAVTEATGISNTPWAAGQLAAHVRTPALAYAASLMTAAGFPTFIAGTTNRDEGAYFGYVGKYSDACVDIQMISDLHKSEVYALAAYLGVPDEVMNAAPNGDMYDGREDADVFGATYDSAELFIGELCAGRHPAALGWKLNTDEADIWKAQTRNLEALAAYNAHKYLVGSPALHLNVQESAVPGGWNHPVLP